MPLNTAYSQQASMLSTGNSLDPKTLKDELVRIGEVAIAKRDDAAFDRYFAKDFVFHGPAMSSADAGTIYSRTAF
jgi:hypothetical protein